MPKIVDNILSHRKFIDKNNINKNKHINQTYANKINEKPIR